MQYFIYGLTNSISEQMIHKKQIKTAKSSYASSTNSTYSAFQPKSESIISEKYDYVPQFFYPLTHQSIQKRILKNDGYIQQQHSRQSSIQFSENNFQIQNAIDSSHLISPRIRQFVNEENTKNQFNVIYLPLKVSEQQQIIQKNQNSNFSFATPVQNQNLVQDTTLQEISTTENSKYQELSDSDKKIKDQVQNFLDDKKILKTNLGINKNFKIEKLSRDVYLKQNQQEQNYSQQIHQNKENNQDKQKIINEKNQQNENNLINQQNIKLLQFQKEQQLSKRIIQKQDQQNDQNIKKVEIYKYQTQAQEQDSPDPESNNNLNKNNNQSKNKINLQNKLNTQQDDLLGIFECTNTEEDEQNYDKEYNNEEYYNYNYQNDNNKQNYNQELQEIEDDIFQKTQQKINIINNQQENYNYELNYNQDNNYNYQQQNSPIQQKFCREQQDIVFNDNIVVNIEGEFMYEGQYQDQQQTIKTGFGILKCMETDIEIYKGDWLNNKYHGQGCQINKNYVFKDSFEWINSVNMQNITIQIKQQENQEINDTKWFKYEGEFENGLFQGFGCLYFSDSKADRLVGSFEQGKVSGQATFYVNNQIKVTGEWINNQLIDQF